MSLLAKIFGLRKENQGVEEFHISFDPFGINFTLPKDRFQSASELSMNNLANTQYIFLQQLAEEGRADAIANGFCVEPGHYYDFEKEVSELFRLPEPFAGKIKVVTDGLLRSNSFTVSAKLFLSHREIDSFKLNGPSLRVGTKDRILRFEDYQLLEAINNHSKIYSESLTETDNIRLVQKLKLLNDKFDLGIDLRHFNDIDIHDPGKVGVTLDVDSSGNGVLSPSYGDGMTPSEHEAYLAQIQPGKTQGSLRIGNRCILLDEDAYAATQEILSQRHLSPEAVKQFIKTPSAFLDAKLVNLENGFSMRVEGITEYRQAYFGFETESSTDWFQGSIPPAVLTTERLKKIAPDLQTLESLNTLINSAKASGATEVSFEGEAIDLSDARLEQTIAAHRDELKKQVDTHLPQYESIGSPEEIDTAKVVVNVTDNDETIGFSLGLDLKGKVPDYEIDTSNLKRHPFPHQRSGISWIKHLYKQADKSDEKSSGGILADDMGLGKTYMSLVGIEEILSENIESGRIAKPTLIVAPVSLLENWEKEVEKTFHKSPFKDIVILQANADLKKYRHKGARRETRQQVDQQGTLENIRYSLKIGSDEGLGRLDMPGRLVLTNYQTLSDYQISMCRIDWGVVVFDEAQNIKNPNTMVTRAAKGLKADLKVVATGTPVENGLQDFWCLMDTAEPGLLGSWVDFRDNFVVPMNYAESFEEKQRIGESIRERIGIAMLRRVKEDHIEGLPKKTIFVGDDSVAVKHHEFSQDMKIPLTGKQLSEYDSVVEDVVRTPAEEKSKVVLGALYKLRNISMHVNQVLKETPHDWLEQSVKTQALTNVIDRVVRPKSEKVIIFLTNKALQALLKLHLSKRYGIDIQIINGDAKTIANKGAGLSRQQMVDQFQAQEGFGIIIMSPVAAGVGLTVTAANHIIHFEREWNPAKEAQATDRVYRIGQEKDVNVWVPIVYHPERPSFEVNLHLLLAKKSSLSNALVVPKGVSADELAQIFNQNKKTHHNFNS